MINLQIKKYATFSSQAVFVTLNEISTSRHTVPIGTETDGATMPRWVMFAALILLFTRFELIGAFVILLGYLFPPFGKYTIAAIVHDYLLESENNMSRHQIDAEMKIVLEELVIVGFWSILMYRIVRINPKLLHWEIG